MKVVRERVGADVTRAQVNAVDAGFCRTSIYVANAAASATEDVTVIDASTEGEFQSNAVEHRFGPLSVDALTQAKERQRAAAKALADARAEVAEAEKDLATAEREAAGPPMTDAERYRRYLASANAERKKRVENERIAMAALGKTSRSKLDQVMGRRTGYGNKRPMFPPMTGK
jgi:hypothetical protein